MSLLLGIEIGGTKLQVVAGNRNGEIQRRSRYEIIPSEGAGGIRHQLEQAVPRAMKEFSPQAIGVGFGGPVDRSNGRIAKSHQIPGWSGFDFKGWIEGMAGVPCRVENDANTAALGEALCGAGKQYPSLFYITLGSGVGGGFVSEGKIFHGASPGECEIGHVRLDRDGTIVEHRCSGWAVDRRIRELRSTHPESLLAAISSSGGEARHLWKACEDQDAAAIQIFNELVADLSFALSHVTHLLHPSVIVLGGGLSLIGEPLKNAVQRALRTQIMEVFQPGPAVELAELREDAVPVGALLLAAGIV